MCKHFTHTETEDPWQGHTIRMCIAATLSASFKVCSDSLALTLSLSLSLVDVITFILDMATSGER